jgi:glutathionyl-hydroquinone reductase
MAMMSYITIFSLSKRKSQKKKKKAKEKRERKGKEKEEKRKRKLLQPSQISSYYHLPKSATCTFRQDPSTTKALKKCNSLMSQRIVSIFLSNKGCLFVIVVLHYWGLNSGLKAC